MAKKAAAKGLGALAKKLAARYARKNPGKGKAYERFEKRYSYDRAAEKLERRKRAAWTPKHDSKGRRGHRANKVPAKTGWYMLNEEGAVGAAAHQARSAMLRRQRDYFMDYGEKRARLEADISWGTFIKDDTINVWRAQKTLRKQAARKARKRRR